MDERQLQALVQWLKDQTRTGACRVVGINGSQGSGKSTLSQRLRELLREGFALQVLVLSIDDLYLSHAGRQQLAQRIHPLLRTRGVPGTHDVELGVQLLQALKSAGPASAVRIPRFIKAIDDRAPEAEWDTVDGPVDLVLFEGWCVGTPAQSEEELRDPVNELEAREDAEGTWRRYVNTQLATAYARLFALIDQLIFLRAPDFDSIYRWRLQQEQENAAVLQPASAAAGGTASRIMGPEQLRRFIQHYERLTRHAMGAMPQRADVVIELGPQHEWQALRFR
jgi:D-glycerate 3-kinase